MTVSRTGFTGDLGYELRIPADDALPVLDAVMEAGEPHRMRPFGDQALNMLRIEAGLPLIGVEFTSSRYAFNDHDRFTPDELGFGWLLKGIDDETRPFVGRRAILAERANGTSRWKTVGLGGRRPRLRAALLRRRAHPAEGRATGLVGDDAVRRSTVSAPDTPRATRTPR